jgi:hypothetical protein
MIAATSNGYIAAVRTGNNVYTVLTSTDGISWTESGAIDSSSGGKFPIAVNGNLAAIASEVFRVGALYDIGGVFSATFASSATTTFGSPAIQWQQSSDGGGTWTNISGAVSSPLSFTPVSADSGRRYRAVYSKDSYTTVNSNAAILTVS